ncbi:cation:dicarboxylate symporter family transporter, partial [Proteus mirabilis]
MDKQQSRVLNLLFQGSLVKQILAGLIAGILLAWLAPEVAKMMSLLGNLFISALKAVAPVLVWVLVMASIANHRQGQKTSIRPILVLYLLATFFAALTAVVASFVFPSVLTLVVNNS